MEKQRDVNRVMTPVIQSRMTTGYEACNAEHGPGTYERMKAHMSRHVTTTKSIMFSEASVLLRDQLTNLQVITFPKHLDAGSKYVLIYTTACQYIFFYCVLSTGYRQYVGHYHSPP